MGLKVGLTSTAHIWVAVLTALIFSTLLVAMEMETEEGTNSRDPLTPEPGDPAPQKKKRKKRTPTTGRLHSGRALPPSSESRRLSAPSRPGPGQPGRRQRQRRRSGGGRRRRERRRHQEDQEEEVSGQTGLQGAPLAHPAFKPLRKVKAADHHGNELEDQEEGMMSDGQAPPPLAPPLFSAPYSQPGRGLAGRTRE